MRVLTLAFLCFSSLFARGLSLKRNTETGPSALDQYIQQATQGAAASSEASAGSIWSASARLTDITSDLRARFVNDMVTIQVTDRASASASGTVKTKRDASAKASVDALGGITRTTGPLANLAKLSGTTQLDGDGQTNRDTSFTTSLAARVTHVLPNGFLVVEGSKTVSINSETQLITVRGIVRPVDLTTANVVRSDRLAQLEVRMNGKGVIGDAVKRPFFLYRLLLGLLPF